MEREEGEDTARVMRIIEEPQSTRGNVRPTTSRTTQTTTHIYAVAFLDSYFSENPRTWTDYKAPYKHGLKHCVGLLSEMFFVGSTSPQGDSREQVRVDNHTTNHTLGQPVLQPQPQPILQTTPIQPTPTAQPVSQTQTQTLQPSAGPHITSRTRHTRVQPILPTTERTPQQTPQQRINPRIRGRATQPPSRLRMDNGTTPSQNDQQLTTQDEVVAFSRSDIEIKLYSYEHEERSNGFAYKLILVTKSDEANAAFCKMVYSDCSQVNALIKEQKDARGFVKKQKGDAHQHAVSYIDFALAYLTDAGVDCTQNDVLRNFMMFDPKRVLDLYSDETANKILVHKGFVPVLQDGIPLCVTVYEYFEMEHFITSTFPHVSQEETSLINNIRRVMTKDPQKVFFKGDLFGSKETTFVEIFSDPKEHSNADTFVYVQRLCKEQTGIIMRTFSKVQSIYDYALYKKAHTEHMHYCEKIAKYMFNLYAPTELTDRYQESTKAALAHIRDKRTVPTKNIHALFMKFTQTTTGRMMRPWGFTCSKDTTFLDMVDTFVSFFSGLFGVLKNDLANVLTMYFGSLAAADSDPKKKVNVLNTGVPGTGKSTKTGVLQQILIPGTFRKNDTLGSAQEKWGKEVRSGMVAISDEIPIAYAKSSRDQISQATALLDGSLMTEGSAGRFIRNMGSTKNDDGKEQKYDVTQLNITHDDSVRILNTNTPLYGLKNNIGDRLSQFTAPKISAPKVAELKQYQAQNRLLDMENTEHACGLFHDIQTVAILMHKSEVVRMIPKPITLLVNIVHRRIVDELGKHGICFPEARKSENLFVLVEQVAKAHAAYSMCCVTPPQTIDGTTPQIFYKDRGVGQLYNKSWNMGRIPKIQQNTAPTIEQILFSFSLLFESFVDDKLELIRTFFFTKVVDTKSIIQSFNTTKLKIHPKETPVLNYDFHIVLLQRAFAAHKRVSFGTVAVMFTSTIVGGSDKGIGLKSTLLNPNYMEFLGNSIEDVATAIINSSDEAKIYNKAQITKILADLEQTTIIPEVTLAYVEKKKLEDAATNFTAQNYTGLANQDGTRAKTQNGAPSIPLPFDEFIRPLKHGEPYHPSVPSDIFDSKKPVPVVYIKYPSNSKNVAVCIHIEIARRDPYEGLRSVVKSFSPFFSKQTVIPIVTKLGYEKITVAPETEDARAKRYTTEKKMRETAKKLNSFVQSNTIDSQNRTSHQQDSVESSRPLSIHDLGFEESQSSQSAYFVEEMEQERARRQRMEEDIMEEEFAPEPTFTNVCEKQREVRQDEKRYQDLQTESENPKCLRIPLVQSGSALSEAESERVEEETRTLLESKLGKKYAKLSKLELDRCTFAGRLFYAIRQRKPFFEIDPGMSINEFMHAIHLEQCGGANFDYLFNKYQSDTNATPFGLLVTKEDTQESMIPDGFE